MTLTKAADILAGLIFLHLFLFAFNVPPLWGDLTGPNGREGVLFMIHFVAVFYAVMRILTTIAGKP